MIFAMYCNLPGASISLHCMDGCFRHLGVFCSAVLGTPYTVAVPIIMALFQTRPFQ
jgi:hypothetical protein